MKKEKTKYWGFRALKVHRQIARKHAKREKVSESAIVRTALEEYATNHASPL
jgi:hypothetical protein